jgi:hypothetical protein
MRIEQAHSREFPGRTFGRKGIAVTRSTLGDDLKLFALTFAAGFLFMSLYLA